MFECASAPALALQEMPSAWFATTPIASADVHLRRNRMCSGSRWCTTRIRGNFCSPGRSILELRASPSVTEAVHVTSLHLRLIPPSSRDKLRDFCILPSPPAQSSRCTACDSCPCKLATEAAQAQGPGTDETLGVVRGRAARCYAGSISSRAMQLRS